MARDVQDSNALQSTSPFEKIIDLNFSKFKFL